MSKPWESPGFSRGGAVKSAIDRIGLTALAAELSVSPQRLANWVGRQVPAERCPDVERATGVRCEVLRPDVDWAFIRAGGAPDRRPEPASVGGR